MVDCLVVRTAIQACDGISCTTLCCSVAIMVSSIPLSQIRQVWLVTCCYLSWGVLRYQGLQGYSPLFYNLCLYHSFTLSFNLYLLLSHSIHLLVHFSGLLDRRLESHMICLYQFYTNMPLFFFLSLPLFFVPVSISVEGSLYCFILVLSLSVSSVISRQLHP